MHDAHEQYLLELINRARLDPMAELARYNDLVASGQHGGARLENLSEGLAPGSITGAAKQVLAGDEALAAAAAGHSNYMLDTDQFNHDGIGNGTPASRAQDAGYASGYVGENIAWLGTGGTINPLTSIEFHHLGLFRSAGHRANVLETSFSEVGLGRELGVFTGSWDANSSMLTENFGDVSGNRLLTGVAFIDANDNDFYSVGEGRGGVAVAVDGGGAAETAAAGGYAIQVAAGERTVTIGGVTVKLTFEDHNLKLDLVDDTRVFSSGDLKLVSGATEGRLLGIEDLSLTGSRGDEVLTGNRGANAINGGMGSDMVAGREGADSIRGGFGSDTLRGDAGTDRLDGSNGDDRIEGRADNDRLRGGHGNDTLVGGAGNDVLVFSDGFGRDRIIGFENGLDRFDFSGHSVMSFAGLSVSASAGHAVIADGQGNRITVMGAAGLIDSADFLF